MAASSATAECKEECKDKDDDALTTTLHTCANDPDFAVICAFMQKFAKDLGLALPNFKHLQEWLTNNDEGTFACVYVWMYICACIQIHLYATLRACASLCVCVRMTDRERARTWQNERECALACLYYCLVWSKAETVKILAEKENKNKNNQQHLDNIAFTHTYTYTSIFQWPNCAICILNCCARHEKRCMRKVGNRRWVNSALAIQCRMPGRLNALATATPVWRSSFAFYAWV